MTSFSPVDNADWSAGSLHDPRDPDDDRWSPWDGEPVHPETDGYEAHRLQVTERHLFDRSWQAVQFAGDFKAES